MKDFDLFHFLTCMLFFCFLYTAKYLYTNPKILHNLQRDFALRRRKRPVQPLSVFSIQPDL